MQLPNLMQEYLDFLNDLGPVNMGPPAKAIQLKACGAEQTDEECPTTARTKKFEKDEAKVGESIGDYVTANPIRAGLQGTMLGMYAYRIAKAKLQKKCSQFQQGTPEYQKCMGGR